jgi:hypothetical protein
METTREAVARHMRESHKLGDGSTGCIDRITPYTCCVMLMIEHSLAIEKSLGWPGRTSEADETVRVLEALLEDKNRELEGFRRDLLVLKGEVEAVRKGTVVTRAVHDYITETLSDDAWWGGWDSSVDGEYNWHQDVRSLMQREYREAIEAAVKKDIDDHG